MARFFVAFALLSSPRAAGAPGVYSWSTPAPIQPPEQQAAFQQPVRKLSDSGLTEVERQALNRQEANRDLLFTACAGGDSAAIASIGDLSTNINWRGAKNHFKTPLMIAGMSASSVEDPVDYISTVRALLANGADLNIVDARGRTALFFAAMSGHADFVKEFAVADDKSGGHDTYGVTALEWATREGKTAIVQALLEMGADPHQKDPGGSCPYHTAEASDIPEMKLLFGITAPPTTAPTFAPTGAPTVPTVAPIMPPTLPPTTPPTEPPTESPTESPTEPPTPSPVEPPTF